MSQASRRVLRRCSASRPQVSTTHGWIRARPGPLPVPLGSVAVAGSRGPWSTCRCKCRLSTVQASPVHWRAHLARPGLASRPPAPRGPARPSGRLRSLLPSAGSGSQRLSAHRAYFKKREFCPTVSPRRGVFVPQVCPYVVRFPPRFPGTRVPKFGAVGSSCPMNPTRGCG